MSFAKDKDSKPMDSVVVRPKVAAWASAVLTTVVVISFSMVYWICPKYFVEHSDTSVYGGAAGAVDVVKKGRKRHPLLFTMAIERGLFTS